MTRRRLRAATALVALASLATPTLVVRAASGENRRKQPAGRWVERPEGQPVIDRGPAGAWDRMAVDNPFVLVHGERYICFYEAQDKPIGADGHEQIGLATSSDGKRWEKHDANPILEAGPEGSWDAGVAKLPVATVRGDRFYLYYTGRGQETQQIGLATSTDLVSWTKHPTNPILPSRPDRWDPLLSTYPAPVLERNGRYHLLYRGMSGFYHDQGVGLAVSENLVHWERAKDEPVIPVDREIMSLAVTRRGDHYLGLAQTPPPRTAERPCWRSDDLRHWSRAGSGRFSSDDVETLSNPFRSDDGWTVLYEKDDRIYRAVLEGELP